MSASTVNPPRAPRVLIVDDEPHNRTLLELMLAPEGFVLSTAASGEEALAMVARQPPDLIILDVMMPAMDGFQVVAKIKSALCTRNIPVIMLTALADRKAKLYGLGAGAEDFLNKPIDRAELCMRVRNLLRLKTSSDEALAHRDNAMGMVSHDLRGLLSGVVLSATLLGDEASDCEEGRRTVEGVQRIQRYAKRMNHLIADLLDVVSMDAGKLSLSATDGDAATVISETVEACGASAARKGISLEFRTGERPLLARFDRDRMLQVLTNLITNALKFTPEGGAIAVRGAYVGGELRLSVSDTGKGIPPGMLESIFERFWQVGQPDHVGLGLGLYISRCIVESHGGKIWAESTLGEGSTFYVAIPGAPLSAEISVVAAAAVVPIAPLTRQSTSGGRALIVDDDLDLCESVAACLGARGFTVEWRTSASDALALLDGQDFDVVVTDLNMDEMTGLAFCKRVVGIRPGLPVIIATALATTENQAAALGAGAYEFITKPYDLERLCVALSRAVKSGTAARQVPSLFSAA